METDIASCFSEIPHEGLMEAVEERVNAWRRLALFISKKHRRSRNFGWQVLL